MFRGVTPALKRLPLSGFFKRTIFIIQGTHKSITENAGSTEADQRYQCYSTNNRLEVCYAAVVCYFHL